MQVARRNLGKAVQSGFCAREWNAYGGKVAWRSTGELTQSWHDFE